MKTMSPAYHENKEMLFSNQSTFKGFINSLANKNGSDLIVTDIHNVKAGRGYSKTKVYIDVCKVGEWVVTLTIDTSNYLLITEKTLGKYPKKQADKMISQSISFFMDYIIKGFKEIDGTNEQQRQQKEAEKQQRDYFHSLRSEVSSDFLNNTEYVLSMSPDEYYNNFITKHNIINEDIKEIIKSVIERKYKKLASESLKASEEVATTQETTDQQTNNTAPNTITYTAGNRSFSSHSEAIQYCIESDFDPDTMITETKEEAGTMQPSPQNNSITDNAITADNITHEPIQYHFYNQTFNTYMKAYNYALNNKSPVTMVLPSNHPSMNNKRLQQLEHEYTFSKGNMSITDIREYLDYVSTLPESLDQQERYHKLKSYIQRYEYKQQQKTDKKERLHNLMKEACTILHFMKKKGLSIVEKGDCGIFSTKYIYNNEVIHHHITSSGTPIEKYHDMILNIFNTHFNAYKDEYSRYTLYWYEPTKDNINALQSIPSYVFNDNTKGLHGIYAFDRPLTASEVATYNLIPYSTEKALQLA